MPWIEVWRILRKDRLAMASLLVIAVCAVLALVVQIGLIAEDVADTHRLKRVEIGEPSVLGILIHIYGTHPLMKFRSFGTLNDRFYINGFGRDLRSPFARKRHTEERLSRVDGPCEPDLRFYMRWNSSPIKPWR